jgi:hypothetical protein
MHLRAPKGDAMSWVVWLFVLGAMFVAALRIYSRRPES